MVENASYRLAYLLLSFGLLMDIVYRNLAHRESSWDLMGLVVVGGGLTTAYQGAKRVLIRCWAAHVAIIMVIAALVALLAVALR